MKIYAVLAFFLATYSGQSTFDLKLADQVIDYQIRKDQYAIVVLEEGISESEARNMAHQRAAELTVEGGVGTILFYLKRLYR